MKSEDEVCGPENPANPAHEDIKSYSAERCFFSANGLEPVELRRLASDTVRTTASGCDAAGAMDVSHVKAFIEYETGFLHANTVGGSNITVSGRDGKKTERFRLVMNAVIYGLAEEYIKAAAEQALETIQVQYGLTRETDREHPEHDDDHDHDHDHDDDHDDDHDHIHE